MTPARRAASSTSVSLASGRPSLMFSRSVSSNRYTSWNTTDNCARVTAVPSARTSAPPIFTAPDWTSKKRAISLAMVVLPEPEGPTIAVMVPAGTWKEAPRITGESALYPKVTSSNSMRASTGRAGASGSGSTGAVISRSI